jgi:hypothetical protein
MRPSPRPDPVTSATAPWKSGVCAVAELLNWDTPSKAARGIGEKRGGLAGCHHKPWLFISFITPQARESGAVCIDFPVPEFSIQVASRCEGPILFTD